MGKPDSAADPVLPVANSSVSNTANLTSSLKRARATGLDPGTALSSSFDFLNEHRLGIKVVAPEDRPLTDGDVPPAGFASPAVTEATTPSPCPVVEPAPAPASAPASPTKRAARPATPPAPPFDSTPDDFGSPSNDPSRASPSTVAPARRVVGFSEPDPTHFPHPSVVAYSRGPLPRRNASRAAGSRRSAPAGAALPLFLCAAVGTLCAGVAKAAKRTGFIQHPKMQNTIKVASNAAVALRQLGGRVVRRVRDGGGAQSAPVDVSPSSPPVDIPPELQAAETLAELVDAIEGADESIGESPMDESIDLSPGKTTTTPRANGVNGISEREKEWLVKSPIEPNAGAYGEALLEGEVLPPPSPRERQPVQSEADVQEEVFAEATRIGRDLIRGLLPTPEAKRSWTPGPFDAVDAGGVESISGSPGTPPHEDETPLAPEDAVKMELAAAIFGESGLEVDIERLGRAVPGPVLTDDDSELDEYSSDDSDYAPSDGSDSQSASESDESDESDESEDDEVAEGAFGPSPAMMMPGMPGSPVVSFMSGGGMGAPMMMGAPMPGMPPSFAGMPVGSSVAGGSPTRSARSPTRPGHKDTGSPPVRTSVDNSMALQQQAQYQQAAMYQQYQQFQQYQAFTQMMQQQQAMMLGWGGAQQPTHVNPAASQGTIFGGAGPRASVNGSVSSFGGSQSFGFGSGGAVAADGKARVSKKVAAAHRQRAAMKRAFIAMKGAAIDEKATRKAAAKAAKREAKEAKRAAKDARRAAERAENFRLAKEAALRELRAQLQPQLAVPA